MSHMIQHILVLIAAASSPQTEFNTHWNDWKAELDGYRLVQPRYGEPREGWSVMVWVMEPLSASKHVKLDHPEENKKDLVTVLKLNLLKKFTTGIYDYSLMLSVFSPIIFDDKATSPAAHRPLKVTFSEQDWCGQTFHQLDSRGSTLESEVRSYFESEGDARERIAVADDTLLEDELWVRLRGLTRPLLPGTYGVVPSLASARLSHTKLALGTLEVRRAAERESITVPAGTFLTTRYDLVLKWSDGRPNVSRKVWIETAYPRRVIAWSADAPGLNGNEPVQERGELTGSLRDTYWEHNRLQDVALRQALKLPQ
jgi:hypothetical protein